MVDDGIAGQRVKYIAHDQRYGENEKQYVQNAVRKKMIPDIRQPDENIHVRSNAAENQSAGAQEREISPLEIKGKSGMCKGIRQRVCFAQIYEYYLPAGQ